MEKTIKQNVLDSIGMIYDKSAKCKLENSIYSDVEKELNVLSEYFNVTSSQSLIIAAVFSLAYKLSMVDISDMGEHFDCNPMKLLEFSDDFEILQKKGILMKDRMGNMPHFELLAEHGLKVLGKNRRRNNIVQPGDIKFKNLHFEKTRMKQLYTLRDLLKKDNFEKMRERLSEKCLPEGINVILHGPPGTGKTETVMQIAKYTGREIMKVEISQSKSMWFGESEKLIKKIFTDYRSYSKDCKATPILLFNEADALFSKRHTAGQSSTSQTENAIQNILLEELESFSGILMATTNLAGNLDRAFERRFLFKIQFEKPGIDIKARIWKSKLPGLSEDACHDLAGRFDFSGGQIENIARKCEIHEIIHGIEVDLNSLIDFCREEIMDKNQAKIGFTIS